MSRFYWFYPLKRFIISYQTSSRKSKIGNLFSFYFSLKIKLVKMKTKNIFWNQNEPEDKVHTTLCCLHHLWNLVSISVHAENFPTAWIHWKVHSLHQQFMFFPIFQQVLPGCASHVSVTFTFPTAVCPFFNNPSQLRIRRQTGKEETEESVYFFFFSF